MTESEDDGSATDGDENEQDLPNHDGFDENETEPAPGQPVKKKRLYLRENLPNLIVGIVRTAPTKTYLFSLADISISAIWMLVFSMFPASTKIAKMYTANFNSGDNGLQTEIW